MGKKAVLVADDDSAVRLTLVRFLKMLRMDEILEAADGQEAIDKVKAAPHLKLILLDLKMPGMDGLKALEKIKQISPKVHVAILTGYPFYGEADQVVQKLGAFDFLVKPVDLDYLERIISVAFSDDK